MQKGERIKSLNGDQVVAFVGEKDFRLVRNAVDVSTLQQWINKDDLVRDIGLIRPFGENKQISKSYYTNLFNNLSVIEVNGQSGEFEYRYPVSTTTSLVTVQDTSNLVEADILGIEDSLIEIVLNFQLQEGHIITTSRAHSLQLVVSGVRKPEPAIGGGYRHYMTLTTNDREMTYDPNLLYKDVQYEIVGHRLKGEFADNYAGIRGVSAGREMVCRFKLHNQTGVEMFLTGAAGSYQPFSGTVTQGRGLTETLLQEATEFGGEYAIIGSKDDILSQIDPTTGKENLSIRGKKLTLASTLRMLVIAEHHKLVSNGVVFQQAGTLRESQGLVKLNEGLYWQMKRAYTIQYGAPGGITRSHLEEASNYAFRNNPTKQVNERRIHFEGGRFAVANVLEIIKDEVHAQMRAGSGLYGAEMLLPKSPVSGGALNELKFEGHRFTEVLINNVGWVTVEEDPTLNRISATGDRAVNGSLTNGYDYTAYSLIIRDVTDQKYTNNAELPRGVEMAKTESGNQGSYTNSNIFLIKPMGSMTYSGSENGRWSSTHNEDITSSSRFQQETFWIYSTVAGWIKDVSKMVVIELDKKAQKGFGY